LNISEVFIETNQSNPISNILQFSRYAFPARWRNSEKNDAIMIDPEYIKRSLSKDAVVNKHKEEQGLFTKKRL